ncbi:unnamed protein product [Closterium sp. Naga37s-1]|nr:unnamed protein product [Closterium sp. Naga37s-1]
MHPAQVVYPQSLCFHSHSDLPCAHLPLLVANHAKLHPLSLPPSPLSSTPPFLPIDPCPSIHAQVLQIQIFSLTGVEPENQMGGGGAEGETGEKGAEGAEGEKGATGEGGEKGGKGREERTIGVRKETAAMALQAAQEVLPRVKQALEQMWAGSGGDGDAVWLQGSVQHERVCGGWVSADGENAPNEMVN